MKRSRAEMFAYLGAPLKNVQWSWGAVRESDGAVFLVVWQDESLRRDRRNYSLVHNQSFWGDTTDSHGLNERRNHIDRVRGGAKAYLIMARAADTRTTGTPRRIEEINSEELFVGGELFVDDKDNIWLERIARMPVDQARC
jgi:hypothetical protein